MRCAYYCCGEQYDLNKVAAYFSEKAATTKIHDKEVLMVEVKLPEFEEKKNIFIFSYGCITFWGINNEKEHELIKELRKFLKDPHSKPFYDSCIYKYTKKETDIDEETDTVYLGGKDPYIKLSISYGLSQSVKLQQFEDSVYHAIKENEHIPQEIIKRGKIHYSRKDLAIKIGELLAEKNSINLHSTILDTPEFFWRRPRYEVFYDLASNFMDIDFRINILNKRLEIIHDFYSVLSNELQHSHSSRLEWIIILLILIEVIITFMKDIFALI